MPAFKMSSVSAGLCSPPLYTTLTLEEQDHRKSYQGSTLCSGERFCKEMQMKKPRKSPNASSVMVNV